MRVLELWRYPVKSMLGEQLEEVRVTSDGLEGDRRFALFDAETGVGLTGRRVPELLFATARWHDGGGVEITTPDGTVARDDDALSAWLDRPVTLRPAEAAGARTYEIPLDFENDEAWVEWEGPSGPFYDAPNRNVSLVSTATIGSWDRRRFRANIIFDGHGEGAWLGRRVGAGTAELDVTVPIDRCVMVTRPQAGGIERDLDVLRTILKEREGNLSVGAVVAREGAVRVGDSVTPA
jgi:uncharacterized protein YcbX